MISITPEYTTGHYPLVIPSLGFTFKKHLTSGDDPKIRVNTSVPAISRQIGNPFFLDWVALKPCRERIDPHEQVHRDDAEPDRHLGPPTRDPKQGHTKRSLAPYGRKYG